MIENGGLLIKIKLWNLFKSLTWYQLRFVYQWIGPERINWFIIHPYFKFIVNPFSWHRTTIKNKPIYTISYELNTYMHL